MASGDVYAVKLLMTFAGQQCRPGFYLVEGTGGAGANPVGDVIDAVIAALGATPLAGFSAACSLEGVQVQDVQPATRRSQSGFLVPAEVGSIADDNPVPPQDSMLIRWVTPVKPIKGAFAADSRTYMPGIYSTGQVSGFLISDLQDALSAFASNLFDPFVSDGSAYAMAAVSFTPGSNPRTIR